MGAGKRSCSLMLADEGALGWQQSTVGNQFPPGDEHEWTCNKEIFHPFLESFVEMSCGGKKLPFVWLDLSFMVAGGARFYYSV